MICQAVPNRLLRPSIGDAWASDDATERRLTRIRNVISWLKHKRFALDCFAYVLYADREGRQGGRRTRRMTERYQSSQTSGPIGRFLNGKERATLERECGNSRGQNAG